MKFLYYLEPFIERQRPFWKAGWLDFAKQFRTSLESSDGDFRLLLGEPLINAALERGFTRDKIFVADYQPFIGRVGRDYLDITSRWYLGETGVVLDTFSRYAKELLDGYQPDVIFSFSPVPFLNQLFPDALVLHIEVGMFSRRPFPLTLYFDACGMFKDSLLCQNHAAIIDFRAAPDELGFVANLRARYINDGLRLLLPVAEEIYGERLCQFRKRVLLPLQFSDYYAFDANCAFASQFDYLKAVLEEVPEDVAVVVTEHPDNPVVTEEINAYLSARYANFVWDIRGRDIYACSQLLLLLCDAVITVTSSVGMHALFYQKPLITLGNSYMEPFADARSLDALEAVLKQGYDPRRDNVLYWLFSRYYVLFESVFTGYWFERFCRDFPRWQAHDDYCPIYTLSELEGFYLKPDAPSLEGVLLGSLGEQSTLDAVISAAMDRPEQEASEQLVLSSRKSASSVLRAIAFHLPQFHTIAENDAWWGEGFTEWSNVRQGKPLFDGHYQPREPDEFGYYDLSDPLTLARQAALAREYGLEGFCFYHYWFDGHRLLEKPVDQLLQHPEIDLPFCLCWANENWTRRWDGGEQEVLMRQSYSPELSECFALDLLPYMLDRRYIRIDGKPVFLVYRSDIIPDLPGTLMAWRDTWRAHGLGEVYLIGVESFQVLSPADSGFDATCEFLPHQVNIHQLGPDHSPNLIADPVANVGDYAQLAEYWLKRPRAPYKRFRGLVPSWDNSARRRKGGATLFVGATPQLYQRWLERTVAKTLVEFQGEERIVFINAWNEWGEGCCLEPDRRHGRAYLEATRQVLQSREDDLLALLPVNERLGNTVYQRWIDANVLTPCQLSQLCMRVSSRPALRVIVVILARSGDESLLPSTLESLRLQHLQADEIWLFGDTAQRFPGMDVRDKGALQQWMQVLSDHVGQFDDWFLVLHAGDRLADHACLLLCDHLQEHAQLKTCYFDEDWQLPIDGSAKPVFKPDFNLDMLRSFPYTGHALALCSRALRELGGLDIDCGELALQDFVFRTAESAGFTAVGHLPEVILHSSEPFETWLARPEIALESAFVTSRHLQRLGVKHEIEQGHLPGFNRVRYPLEIQPLVSIVVPTRDQLPMLQRCLESVIERTSYPRYELLVVDNASETPEARSYLAGLRELGSEQIRVLSYPNPFNYAAINNFAVAQARGELTLLLNNDTAVLHADWLDRLVSLALRPEVGLVSPKLLYPDGTIQHAGVVLGLRGPADHPFLGVERDAPGYMHRLQVEQNYSALTAACLMIPTQLYRDLGGMDEEVFKVSYNDVDLCLKVREAGYLAVWTPHASLLHEGSVSQRQVDRTAQQAKRARFVAEQDAFYARWHHQIGRDPAYNKNLSLNAAGFEFESDTALTWRPVGWRPEPVVLAHPADHAGCGHYRVIQPFEALRKAGFADGMISDGLLSVADLERYSPDVIVLQRQIGEERLEAMRRIKAFSSAYKVYELDDYLPNLPLKNLHRANISKDILRTIKRGCSYVDRFVVSTEALAEAFVGVHSDIRVVLNRLPSSLWGGLSATRRQGARPRVGWAGGISHGGDLELIADVVRELAGEVEWVFFGMCPERLRPYVSEFYAGVSIERYPEQLAALGLDLALAPVEQNLFNECKSNLRLLEYGACGFPVICSDVGCYRGDLPVTRVKNRFKDWVDAIRMHISDLDAAAKLGDELHERVTGQWMLEGANLEHWRAAWMQS